MMRELIPSLEIRHLPRHVTSELGNILQIDQSWRDVMGLVPGKPWIPGNNMASGLNFPRKYSSEDISLVAEECARVGRTGFEILIEEWGTSGRIRPKVSDLIHLLYKAGLERAASYLEGLVCGQDTEDSEDASNNTTSTTLEIISQESISCKSANRDSNAIPESSAFESLQGLGIPFINYNDVLEASKTGSKIGKGAFGSVYKALIGINGEERTVAIKFLFQSQEITKLLLEKEKVFKTEVEILSKCIHKNIIKLEGYSYNESDLAILYSYMVNGSLYDRLACVGNSPPLPWKQRLSICEGTAEGIVYLHTKFSPPLVHRDVKSPNILLDENFIPKLGDFGIVRLGGRGSANTVIQTTPVGTQMYMAPEAFRGDVSVKMDTFSFAIVVLELLTGLPFYDEEKQTDILSFYESYEEDMITLLDASAGDWNTSVGNSLFEFVEICTRDKGGRPDMEQALKMLKSIFSGMA